MLFERGKDAFLALFAVGVLLFIDDDRPNARALRPFERKRGGIVRDDERDFPRGDIACRRAVEDRL